jgi:cell division protease FtsH
MNPESSADTGRPQRRPAASGRRPAENGADNGDDSKPKWRIEGLGSDHAPPGGRRTLPSGWFWLMVLGLFILNWLVAGVFLDDTAPRLTVPYTRFMAEVDDGNVAEISARGDTIKGTFAAPVVDPDDPDLEWTEFETERPAFADDDLYQRLIDGGVVVSAEPVEAPAPFWQQLLFGFGPTLLILVLMFSLFRRMGRGLGGLGGLGASKATRYEPTENRVSFDDVAGIDEAEAELAEVVDFLRNPAKYTKLGATVPRGVLLSGVPGTGKTLLARAVAGEAGVPFFSIAASEFVEMIVGVGASRVRDLFDQAKAAAPAIIFIDEIDGIGRARGASVSFGGHDEREQTLNQILAEMDGFTGAEDVVVMAATNRPDVLDPALLRPGRFDRHVVVSAPDLRGRSAILGVHTRKVPLDPALDLDDVASMTPGMVGADLRNLVNEAALLAARREHATVSLADFTEALERIVLGAERKIMLSPEDRERTAYHESGHALLGILQPGADPVRKVSIIPRGRALGVTLQSPETDVYSYSQSYLRGKITGALGGRAAEELVYGEYTTGAENDLELATQIARRMVGRWGMSDRIGPVAVLPTEDEMALPLLPSQTSPETQALVDAEVRRIIDECHEVALAVLQANRASLDTLATALLEHETLDEDSVYALVGPATAVPPTEPNTMSHP